MSVADQVELPAAYSLEEYGEIDCLRTIASDRAKAGAEEATLLVAENLRAPSGLCGKSWQGFNENFHSALILEPDFEPERYHEMLFVALVSLGNSLATHVAPMTSLTYRWPNDLYIAGQKVGSVWLDQARYENSPRLILTTSVNLMHAPGDDSGDFSLPTMSVREAEGNSDITVPVLLETWTRQFIAEINNWNERGFEHILAYWKVREEPKDLAGFLSSGGFGGRIVGTSVNGDAIVETPDGGIEKILLTDYIQGISTRSD